MLSLALRRNVVTPLSRAARPLTLRTEHLVPAFGGNHGFGRSRFRASASRTHKAIIP